MVNNLPSTKEKIHNFFEQPKGFAAYLVQFIIFILIIASVALVIIEFFYTDLFEEYKTLFIVSNYIILAAFTVEYVLRIATAPKKLKWAIKPLNVIDFIAIFPNYLELILPFFVPTTALRALRLIRMLRFARILRGFRLFKYGGFLRKVLRYQDTILQTITPIIAILIVLKGGIWILEYFGYWFSNQSLGELFAIIGFALGIVLSQKIAASYDKFIQVEEASVRIYGTLQSLTMILNKIEPDLGTKTCKSWAKKFLELLENPKADNYQIHQANDELYQVISKVEPAPAEMAILHGDICRDAAFCLSKKVRLTPKAYDTLLHQSTILYMVLIIVFIPGFTGMLSVFIATYILYGMYNLTEDFDSIIGGEFNLININISELKYLASGNKK